MSLSRGSITGRKTDTGGPFLSAPCLPPEGTASKISRADRQVGTKKYPVSYLSGFGPPIPAACANVPSDVR